MIALKVLKNYPVAWLITVAVIVLSVLVGQKTAQADMLSVKAGDWVCDGAGVLSEETEEAVRAYNTQFDQDYGAYVAVATVKNLRGWEPDAYAQQLFGAWELYGNDFLLMLDIGGGQSYLYYGSNRTGFNHSTYLEQYVNPSFLQGDYDAAVLSLFPAMESYLSSGLTVTSGDLSDQPADTGERADPLSVQNVQEGGSAAAAILVLVLVIVVILAVILIVVLTTLLVAPYFVDWNGQRASNSSASF